MRSSCPERPHEPSASGASGVLQPDTDPDAGGRDHVDRTPRTGAVLELGLPFFLNVLHLSLDSAQSYERLTRWSVGADVVGICSANGRKDCSQSMLLRTPTASISTERTGVQFLQRPTGFGGIAMKVSFIAKTPTRSIPTDHDYSDQLKS